MPLADPEGLQQLELPGADAAALGRRVRACGRRTQAASEHKTRIKDLVRQLMPMTPLTGDIGKADLAVLERSPIAPVIPGQEAAAMIRNMRGTIAATSADAAQRPARSTAEFARAKRRPPEP